ncbi:MAG: phosphatase PAP2 family protein [Planctomycetes bacterium]|nr:phosphatase PAP2 family protein [Planctomycetota bacterium]
MRHNHIKHRWNVFSGAAAFTLLMAGLLSAGAFTHQDAGSAKPTEKVLAGEKREGKASAKSDWIFPECAKVDLAAIVGPPPALGSPEQLADISTVLFEQTDRNALDEETAWTGVNVDVPFFNRALGARFERDWYPKTYALVMDAIKDTKKANDAAKKNFKRPRPYATDARVKPCIPLEDSFCYPSGHAIRAMVMSLVLTDLVPERAEQLAKYAQLCGYSRVQGGVHYPTDILAGFKGAAELAKAILASPEWAARKAEVMDEVAQLKKHSTWGGNIPH